MKCEDCGEEMPVGTLHLGSPTRDGDCIRASDIVMRNLPDPVIHPEPECPAWADGRHCFVESMGRIVEVDKDAGAVTMEVCSFKRCACGAEVGRVKP